jgi:hypothetical protein
LLLRDFQVLGSVLNLVGLMHVDCGNLARL